MIVFDDAQSDGFYPLTLNRSVGDLRCGILKLRQRWQALLEDEDSAVWIAPRLAPLYRERHPDWQINQTARMDQLHVNSRLQPTPETAQAVKSLRAGQYLHSAETVVAVKGKPEQAAGLSPTILDQAGFEAIPLQCALYDNLSDLIHENDRLLRHDFDQFFYDRDNFFETEPGVTVLHPYNVWIAEGVELKPGVVLDASDGPIVLDEGVRVLPNAVITGPAYIGKRCLIKVGAKIYGSTSLGPVCKVGGEVEGCVFQAYSNKQHDGFLGHSYVGEWVNLGADTNNSDLKNTYKPVAFHSYRAGGKIPSGKMFLGALIADHAKLGINASLNTGCVIGLGSNLWGSSLISDFVPDFSWGQACSLDRYRFDAFCQTAATVKQRRGLDFTPIEAELYRQIRQELERT